jgi:hypothetical protein
MAIAMKLLPFFSGLLLVASCGGSTGAHSTGNASISGSFQGNSFVPQDAVSYSGNVAIVDFPNLCAYGLADAKSGAKYLYLNFTSGTFPLGTTSIGPDLSAQLIANDATCNSVAEGGASGTVNVSSVDASGVAGTFDIVFEPDHLTGSFDAPTCNMPGNGKCQ